MMVPANGFQIDAVNNALEKNAAEIAQLRADNARLKSLLFRVRNYIAGERTNDRPQQAMLEQIDTALA